MCITGFMLESFGLTVAGGTLNGPFSVKINFAHGFTHSILRKGYYDLVRCTSALLRGLEP